MKKKLFIAAILVALLFTLGINYNSNLTLAAEEVKDERQFKAVWMSNYIGDASYQNESQFKNLMTSNFEVLQYYGINALIFHVRTHNNAFYASELNPRASWYQNVDFEVFDPIGWLISESHKRGIEFHAWMNPYRVSTSYQRGDLPAVNPQSDINNLIVEGNSRILNPDKEVVREHIYDTIIEFAELYPNVDAIHFDDYFYISTTAEPATASGKRENINMLIEGIDEVLTLFNLENNTNIQFGISPTGIYKNGNGEVTYDEFGNPISSGSDTRGQEHYASYLFADTVKWSVEGWIDYLIPQVYWASNHNIASFTKINDWWDQIFKYLDVNLYSGIGVYMANNSNTFNWGSDMFEMDNQYTYLDTKESILGYSIFSYSRLRDAYNGGTAKSSLQINNAYSSEERRKVTIPPIVKSMEPVYPLAVGGVVNDSGVLSFEESFNAKFYYIYYSAEELTYSTDQIIGVVGKESESLSFDVSEYGFGSFGVRAISKTNHLSPVLNSDEVRVTFNYGDYTTGEVINKGTKITEPIEEPTKEGYLFKGWYYNNELYDFNNIINNDITIYAKWEKIIYYVNLTFHHGYDSIFEVTEVEKDTFPKRPTDPIREGYIFKGWYFNNDEYLFTEVLGNSLTLVAKWEEIIYDVSFDYGYDDLITVKKVTHNSVLSKPDEPSRSGYKFLGWYKDDEAYLFNEPVLSDLLIVAKWDIINEFDITIINDTEVSVIKVLEYDKLEEPKALEKPGYIFKGWYKNNTLYDFNLEVNESFTLTAVYEEISSFNVVFIDDEKSETEVVEEGKRASEPLTPSKEGYTFTGWYKDNVIYDFNTVVSSDITLIAKYIDINDVDNVSIYKETTFKEETEDKKAALIYYGLVSEDKKAAIHGFYLIYGKVSYDKLMLEILNADGSLFYINGKVVYNVIVSGLKSDNTYSIRLTGIPNTNYDDLITVVPYIVLDDNIVIAETFMVSSVNHAKAKNVSISVIESMDCLLSDIKRKDAI